jgi:hypothetical protein
LSHRHIGSLAVTIVNLLYVPLPSDLRKPSSYKKQ